MEVRVFLERFLELLGSGTLKTEAGNAFFPVVVGLVSRRVLFFYANKLCFYLRWDKVKVLFSCGVLLPCSC